jgi:hypothetical protein
MPFVRGVVRLQFFFHGFLFLGDQPLLLGPEPVEFLNIHRGPDLLAVRTSSSKLTVSASTMAFQIASSSLGAGMLRPHPLHKALRVTRSRWVQTYQHLRPWGVDFCCGTTA